jgi:hypothetical protein
VLILDEGQLMDETIRRLKAGTDGDAGTRFIQVHETRVTHTSIQQCHGKFVGPAATVGGVVVKGVAIVNDLGAFVRRLA